MCYILSFSSCCRQTRTMSLCSYYYNNDYVPNFRTAIVWNCTPCTNRLYQEMHRPHWPHKQRPNVPNISLGNPKQVYHNKKVSAQTHTHTSISGTCRMPKGNTRPHTSAAFFRGAKTHHSHNSAICLTIQPFVCTCKKPIDKSAFMVEV